jgi:putative heme iron utilization protein
MRVSERKINEIQTLDHMLIFHITKTFRSLCLRIVFILQFHIEELSSIVLLSLYIFVHTISIIFMKKKNYTEL